MATAGGGGGGGYFGGGGGAAPNLAEVAAATYAGGGGGGSGFGPSGTTYESGVQTGDGQVTITPAAPGVGCLTATLQVQKVVGFNSEVGFVEHVTCDVANEGSLNVDLPYLSDGTPDAVNGPSDWTAVDGTWQHDFSVHDISCTVTETDQGDAELIRYACGYTPAEAPGVAPADLPEFGCPGLSAGPSFDPTDSGTVVLEGNGDSGAPHGLQRPLRPDAA